MIPPDSGKVDIETEVECVYKFRLALVALKRVWFVVGLGLCVVCGMAVPSSIQHNDACNYANYSFQHNHTCAYPIYLDERGIKACVGATVGLAMLIVSSFGYIIYKVPPRPKAKERKELQTPPAWPTVVPDDQGCGIDSLHKVFGAHKNFWTLERMKDALAMIAPILINMAGFVNAVLHLPERNPELPMDLPKHAIPMIEFGIFTWQFLQFLPKLFMYSRSDSAVAARQWLGVLGQDVRLLQCFSCVALLGAASVLPQLAIYFVKRPRIGIFLTLFLYTVCVYLGVSALCTKIAALSFVGTALISKWTRPQMIMLASFVNNVIHIHPGMPGQSEIPAFKALSVGMAVLSKPAWKHKKKTRRASGFSWGEHFATSLEEYYGRAGALLVYLTLTQGQVLKLFNAERRDFTCLVGTPLEEKEEGGKKIRDVDKDEMLTVQDGPPEESSGTMRMKVRANKDGREGWVTLQKEGKAMFARQEPSSAHHCHFARA